MTRDDAIAAINKASAIYVYAVTAKSPLGDALYAETFAIPKAAALAAMQKIVDAGAEPAIHVSTDGAEVTLGAWHTVPPAQNSSHFDNNNGNF